LPVKLYFLVKVAKCVHLQREAAMDFILTVISVEVFAIVALEIILLFSISWLAIVEIAVIFLSNTLVEISSGVYIMALL